MNPVPLMRLVELIRGQATSPDSMQVASALCTKLGKTPVEAADYPGFIANRILMPMINEAIYALMEGVGTREAIDAVMKLGMNHPMGPLTLADFIGLDVCLAILEVLHGGLGDGVGAAPDGLLQVPFEAGAVPDELFTIIVCDRARKDCRSKAELDQVLLADYEVMVAAGVECGRESRCPRIEWSQTKFREANRDDYKILPN